MSLISKGLILPAVAAVASLAYLDAKLFISQDVQLLWLVLRMALAQRRLDSSGNHNFFHVLEGQALNPRSASTLCLIYEGREWTYKQVYDAVLSYGTWLKSKYNIRKDEMIALDCMNRPNFIFMWLGLWSIGAKVAFINYNLTAAPLLHSVRSSGARLLLVDEDVRDCFPQTILDDLGKASTEVAFFSDSLEQEVAAVQGVREPDGERGATSGTETALLIFTSGTTGLPKPAAIQWNKVNGAAIFGLHFLQLTTSDRYFTCMPLYHSAASVVAATSSIAAGCTLVLGHRFSTKTFFPTIRQSKVTVMQYVGETCRYLLSAPPDPLDKVNNLRLAFGNGLRPDIWNKFKERFDIPEIVEFYASTEGTGGSWNRSRNDLSLGAVGRSGALIRLLFGGRSILVVHDHNTESPYRDPKTGFCSRIDTTKRGSPPGELLYKLPDEAQERLDAFPGYYNNEAATNSKVLRNVLVDGDAYFRTGDLVRHDHEGRVYFHDRIGDSFRWKSENVSTSEVADVLGRHPAVAEANVYGVEVPHHDGRAGCAAIVLKGPGGSADGAEAAKVDHQILSSIAQHAQATLPRYAQPMFLRLTSTMETTGTNKQSKVALRQEGIEPKKIGSTGDQMFWLQGQAYERFADREWDKLNAGNVKL